MNSTARNVVVNVAMWMCFWFVCFVFLFLMSYSCCCCHYYYYYLYYYWAREKREREGEKGINKNINNIIIFFRYGMKEVKNCAQNYFSLSFTRFANEVRVINVVFLSSCCCWCWCCLGLYDDYENFLLCCMKMEIGAQKNALLCGGLMNSNFDVLLLWF